MVSIARAFDRILRDNFRMNAAWLPLTSSFRLGEYGLWRGGVFQAIGNVADDFGVELREVEGSPVNFDFTSQGVQIIDAGGGAKGQVKSLATVDAAAEVKAQAASSFVLRAPSLTSRRLENVAAIGARLLDARRRKEGPRWRTRYKLVSEVFVGDAVTILATIEAETTILLRGKASDAKELLSGNVKATVSADKSLGLSLVGASGPVGLRLVRVRPSGVVVASFGEDLEDAGVEVVPEDRWDQEIVDDPEDDDDDDEGAAV
ncbi:MAG: hypothetical protein H6710_19330 [Myxococcales bacterium]|nr:hypothetical protein [Myxococcales bacterium]